jgi:hypothetical protein
MNVKNFYLNKLRLVLLLVLLLVLVFRFLLFRFRRLPSGFGFLKDKRMLAAASSICVILGGCGCTLFT